MKLSVIIPSYNASATIRKTLESLDRQNDIKNVEVIVIDSSSDGTADIVIKEFPFVKLYTYLDRKYPGDARNLGISKAKGEIIAFTDADCFFDSDWISRTIEAHTHYQDPIIGGAVDNGNQENYVGGAHYFSEFSQWMPQLVPCYKSDQPTVCLTVKRWVFDKYGGFLEKTYSLGTAFNWKLKKNGYCPFFIPQLRVYHINITKLIKECLNIIENIFALFSLALNYGVA